MAHQERVRLNYADCDPRTLGPVTIFTETLTTGLREYNEDFAGTYQPPKDWPTQHEYDPLGDPRRV